MNLSGPQQVKGRPANRPSLLVAAAAAVLVLALTLAGCGAGGETTTSVAVQPDETTTSLGLPGTLATASTEPAGDTTTTAAPAEETTIPTTAGEATVTTEKLSTAEQRLANGHIKAMGFIKKVWEQDGKLFLSIDYAEMLTGRAAVDAAIEDRVISPDEDLPNDYYIRNNNSEKREFAISEKVAITTSTWVGGLDHPVTWEVFKSFWSAVPADEQAGFLRDSPWWIERDGQTVVKIDEQYLP